MIVVSIEQVEKALSNPVMSVPPFRRVELANNLTLVGVSNKIGVISFHYPITDLRQYLRDNDLVKDVNSFINSLKVSTY